MIHKQSGFTLNTKSKKTTYDSTYMISRSITNKSGQDDLLHGLLNNVKSIINFTIATASVWKVSSVTVKCLDLRTRS